MKGIWYLTFLNTIYKKMKLSIIVPVFNVEKYIARCLDGLLEQDMSEYEIIVVNDGTQDKSMDYVRYYSEMHSNIVIIEQKNGGLSSARNTGIRYAKGEYLFFCDSDDTIIPNCLNKLYEEARANRLDMLLFDADTLIEKKENVKEKCGYYRNNVTEDIIDGRKMLNELLKKGEYYASACMYLIRKEFVDKNNILFCEDIIHEDELFTPIALINAKRVRHRNWPIYQRYIREGSIMTGTSEQKHLEGISTVILELRSFYGKSDTVKENKRLLKKIVKNHIRNFLGRVAWMNEENESLLQKRNKVLKIIKQDHLWLGMSFYLYLFSIRFRKTKE